MPKFHVSYQYNQTADDRAGGWTENFWLDASSFRDAQVAAIDLAKPLAAIHGAQANMRIIRINQDGVKRRSLRLRPSNFFDQGATNKGDADYPTTAIGVELIAANGNVARMWIKGVLDDAVTGGGVLQRGLIKTNLNKIKTLLEGDGWNVRGIDQSVEPKDIQALTLSGAVQSTGHGLDDGDKYVRVSGFSVPPGLNRIWRVTKTDADHYQLQFFRPLSEGSLIDGHPRGRVQHIVFSKVSSADFVRATEHRVGRPTGSLGGRRKKR